MAEVSISMSGNDTRMLFLNEEVEDTSVKPLIEAIVKWNHEDDIRAKKEKDFERQPIKLYINSPGGAVRDGFGLVNAMTSSLTPIHTYTVGMAASMALLIAVAGHKRYGYKLSSWMYHQVSGGTRGRLKDIQEKTEDMKTVEDMYDAEIVDRSSVTQEHLDLVKSQKRDWYIYHKEAFKLRLVDEII